MDDIITCAASIFIRSDFSMNYKFTDLKKHQNYIGFESGIICKYPSIPSPSYLDPQDHGCFNNTWYIDKYLDAPKVDGQNVSTPLHYDPRCRTWYKSTYKSLFPVFTEIYRFTQNNRLGITNCVPIWDLSRSIDCK